MNNGTKRLLAAMLLLACLLPFGATAFAKPCVLPECYCEDCNCEVWCGYHPYGCDGKNADGTPDYKQGKKAMQFKGNGGALLDKAKDGSKQMAWIGSGQTLYADLSSKENGYVMVYYNSGNSRGWAKYNQLTAVK